MLSRVGVTRTCLATVIGALVLGLGMDGALAQRAAAVNQEENQQQSTRRTPAMRNIVYEDLAIAQECAEMEDYVCAMEALQEVRDRDDLNSYEVAQMWTFYAFIYYSQEMIDESLNAYLQVLQQPDLPEGLETDTMFTVAQLYQASERYRESLDMLDRWFTVAPNPNPRAYYLKSVLHYQLEEFANGLEPIQTAISMATANGDQPEEGWYQLLNVFYFELEDYPGVIRTLTTLSETWPKRDYLIQLAGVYGQEGEERNQLALFDSVYQTGWIDRGTEMVTLAQMWMQAGGPFRAATILETGLESGDIEGNVANWRLLGQAWQLAQEDEKVLPAYGRASELADDGELDIRIAQSYANLARWEECAESIRTGLSRGGVDRDDQANLLLGQCLFEQRLYNESAEAFRAASRDDRSRSTARQWIDYVEGEARREREVQAMLR